MTKNIKIKPCTLCTRLSKVAGLCKYHYDRKFLSDSVISPVRYTPDIEANPERMAIIAAMMNDQTIVRSRRRKKAI